MNPMLRLGTLVCAVGGLLLAAARARAETAWLLTTADFVQQPVTLKSIDAAGFHCLGGDSKPLDVAMGNFLQLDRTGVSAPAMEKFALVLLSGDRLLGAPTGYKDEQVLWHNAALGDVQVPLKQARALLRTSKSIDALDQARTDDMLMLANGDSVKGIVTNLTDSKVTINSNGSDLELPLANVDAVLFAQAGRPEAVTTPLFRLRLSEGSLITARTFTCDEKEASLALLDNSQRKVSLSSVASIELLNGPVSWLSSRTPAAIVQTPYFGSVAWPTRMDQTVGGKPITLAGRTYARGIGVHAYSRIDYRLDGSYAALRTQYAIANDTRNQFADVTVRIKLDGKTVHEAQHVRADSASPVVVLDIPKSATLLTLEVDYGDANDTQDRFNWIEPALLRTRPAAPPATRPATAPSGQR